MNAKRRPASGRNAKKSRRAGVRSYGQKPWIRPIRLTYRAIDSTLRRITSARLLLNECETFAGVRPIWATRQLERVAGLLVEASDRLSIGVKRLNTTNECLALAPEDAGDAPERMIVAMERWIVAAGELAILSNRLEDTSATLLAYVQSGIAPLDLSELLRKRSAPKPVIVIVRHPSPRLLSIENDRIFCIHVRRQRSARVTVAEAPRRIFRGRAPPLVSTCTL